MKKINFIALLFISNILIGCGHSNDELLKSKAEVDTDSYEDKNLKITKSSVLMCKIEGAEVDFCSIENLKKYNQSLSEKINFSEDKVLIPIKYESQPKIGGSRNIISIVVLDPKQYKVYPFYQTVGNFVNDRLEEDLSNPPVLNFNKSDNKLCLSGTTFSHEDSNINVENECYAFIAKEKDYFKKINIKVKGEVISKSIDFIPYHSSQHIKCVLSQKECSGLNLKSANELSDQYDFIYPHDGDSAVLPENKEGNFIIVSPYEDGGGINLRIMLIHNTSLLKEKNISLHQGDIVIDENYKLHYRDQGKPIQEQF